MRDPFVVPAPGEGIYYLFGTNPIAHPKGFDCYRSSDLQHWIGPRRAWKKPKRFWADHAFWAPEVHAYRGRFYLLASFKAEGVRRGTQILVADSLAGPYGLHSDGPVTPRDWDCLDGTLHVDGAGKPWMVFCHEWCQARDGRTRALPLSDDLRQASAAATILFTASQAPWARPLKGNAGCYVTDGPWLHRTASNHLLMLWSSVDESHYNLGIARSTSGSIAGPWTHDAQPLLSGEHHAHDGGHGMLFRTFDGHLMLSIHAPNSGNRERPIFLPVEERGDRLILQNSAQPIENSARA